MSLEQRVRSTLKDAGSRIDTTAEPTRQPFTATSRSKRRRFRPMLAFVAGLAAVLLFGVVAVLVSGQRADPASDPQATFSGLLGSIVDQLPNGFDPEQAAPLLTLEGNPEEIASEYLETRIPTIGAGIKRVEEQDGYTLVQWAWGRLLDPDNSQSERGETGWLLLRPLPGGYEVVAATTDGVDLSDLSLSDGAVKGVVESNSGEFIGADVLSLDGSPVDSAPHPDGFFPDAMTLWGTSGASSPPLALDVPVSEQVIIRVNRVGGTLLSTSEVILGSSSTSLTLTVNDLEAGVAPAAQALLGSPGIEGFKLEFGRDGQLEATSWMDHRSDGDYRAVFFISAPEERDGVEVVAVARIGDERYQTTTAPQEEPATWSFAGTVPRESSEPLPIGLDLEEMVDGSIFTALREGDPRVNKETSPTGRETWRLIREREDFVLTLEWVIDSNGFLRLFGVESDPESLPTTREEFELSPLNDPEPIVPPEVGSELDLDSLQLPEDLPKPSG